MEMIRWETPAFCRVSTLSRLSSRPLVQSRFWMPSSRDFAQDVQQVRIQERFPAGVNNITHPGCRQKMEPPAQPLRIGHHPVLGLYLGETTEPAPGITGVGGGNIAQTPGPPGPAILSDLLFIMLVRLMVYRPDPAAAGIRNEKIPWLLSEAGGVPPDPPAWSGPL